MNRVILFVIYTCLHGFHKFVFNFNRYVGPGNFALFQFCIDKAFRVGVFDGNRKHKRSAATVLGHFAGRVGIAFHKRNDSGRGKRRIFYRRTFWPDVRQIVPHTSAAFHKLNLLLVNFHNSTIRVRISVVTNNETVRKRGNLVIVANACHGSTLRYNVPEIFQNIKNFIFCKRVRVPLFNS